MKNKIILTYGTLSKDHGGKITTGLNKVIWQTVNELNKLNTSSLSSVFLTYSFRKRKKTIEQTVVYGFYFIGVVVFSFKNLRLLNRSLFTAFNIYLNYKRNIIRSFLKYYFLSMAIVK